MLTGTGEPRTRSRSRSVHSEVTNNKSDVVGIATSDNILGSSMTTAGSNTERALRSAHAKRTSTRLLHSVTQSNNNLVDTKEFIGKIASRNF